MLTLTLIHDRYLSANPTKQTPAEAFHWYRGTELFRSTLSRPIPPSIRDALWATAALLGAIAFANLDATTPSEVWPLRPSSPADLDWLRMSDGKKAVFQLADPHRPDSLFHSTFSEHRDAELSTTISSHVLSSLSSTCPPEFLTLYDLHLNNTSTPGPPPTKVRNPYHATATALLNLLPLPCNQSTILKFLHFITYVDPPFKSLLERKDPKALLLLAYWYAKICQYQQWWIWRRACLECQAICIYLSDPNNRAEEIEGLGKLLRFPRLICGMDAKDGG
ncbi:MAG: hypothetical protein Q9227_000631 [Pyrenula ochraceoflavens]